MINKFLWVSLKTSLFISLLLLMLTDISLKDIASRLEHKPLSQSRHQPQELHSKKDKKNNTVMRNRFSLFILNIYL